MAREDDIADKFNQIFQLELDWGDKSATPEVSPSEIVEFAKLIEQILPMIRLREVQNAIWILTQNKSLLPLALQDDNFMRSLDTNRKERAAIEKSLRDEYCNPMVFLDKGRDFERELTEEDMRKLLELFYPRERELLHEAGLNQSSVAVIVSKLQRCEESVRKNLLASRSVLTGKYVEVTNVLHRQVDALRRRVLAARSDVRTRRIKLTSPITLLRSREKIIGLATLWGNAVPLIITKDWGIASVISTTAGATVAAVLPSGQRKKNSRTRRGGGPDRSSSPH